MNQPSPYSPSSSSHTPNHSPFKLSEEGITYTPNGQWLGFLKFMLYNIHGEWCCCCYGAAPLMYTHNSVISSYRLKYSLVSCGVLLSPSAFSSCSCVYSAGVGDAGLLLCDVEERPMRRRNCYIATGR